MPPPTNLGPGRLEVITSSSVIIKKSFWQDKSGSKQPTEKAFSSCLNPQLHKILDFFPYDILTRCSWYWSSDVEESANLTLCRPAPYSDMGMKLSELWSVRHISVNLIKSKFDESKKTWINLLCHSMKRAYSCLEEPFPMTGSMPCESRFLVEQTSWEESLLLLSVIFFEYRRFLSVASFVRSVANSE